MKKNMENIKNALIEECIKQGVNYSEFMEELRREIEYIELQAEEAMEMWD